jgi:hypothetical protein
MEVTKKIVDGRHFQLTAGQGEFIFQQMGERALLVTIIGNDHGQFGSTALDEIRLAMLRNGELELLIDAERAANVSVEVSQEWTKFFSASRDQLSRVSVLTGTKLINLTVAIAQHLSNTGNMIQIYTDRGLFEAALAQAGKKKASARLA